ncbi:2Fe-2S iron-sulfur cluster-binding protein [Planctomycetota bacterium]
MPRITIDGKSVDVVEGSTILDAAQKLGIDIPTLCFLKDMAPTTSCMVCVVKVEGRKTLLPACGTRVQESMVVLSEDETVREARRTALEFLLSDHVGDCMGPCQVACPAHMNIPKMIREIAAGLWDEAIQTVKQDIALPSVAGRICSAPCEKACRRAQVDEPVSICLLKRFVGDEDLKESTPHQPASPPATGKRVAIVGAGPAGLAAAFYLQQAGFACTVYDDRDEAGGMLRYGVKEKDLPRSVLSKEIAQIRRLGVNIQLKTRVGQSLTLVQLREEFGAVFLAIGASTSKELGVLGFDTKSDKLKVKQQTYETDIPGVFAGGDVWRQRKMVIRALADGKEAAVAIEQYLRGLPVIGAVRPFNSRMGKLEKPALDMLAGPACAGGRMEPAGIGAGFVDAQARFEAQRCLHCDCRKPDTCKLRIHAQAYGAKDTRYRGARRLFNMQTGHHDLIYESGKCIDCGLCIRITEQQGEKLGLTFIGRGFDVKVAVPFNRSIEEALTQTAREVVAACPTGALAFI